MKSRARVALVFFHIPCCWCVLSLAFHKFIVFDGMQNVFLLLNIIIYANIDRWIDNGDDFERAAALHEIAIAIFEIHYRFYNS